MLVLGTLSIIAGVVSYLDIDLLTLSGGNRWLLTAASTLVFLCGVTQIAAGVVGLRGCQGDSDASSCIHWGIAVIIATAAMELVRSAGGQQTGWFGLMILFAFPALFLVGAYGKRKDPFPADR